MISKAKKKLIWAFLLVALALSTYVGCSSDVNDMKKEETTTIRKKVSIILKI
jgi:hypothetical protein